MSRRGRTLRIGLTFDLADDHPVRDGMPRDARAELDDRATIDAIANALEDAGHSVHRIGGLARLLEALRTGPLPVDIVFNVAEGVHGRAREAQVPVLLEAYGVAYTGSDPVATALTLDKAAAKRVWIGAGLPTAPFAVVDDEGALHDLEFELPAFVKPLAEGSSMGIDAAAVARDRDALAARVRHVWDAYGQGALVEPYLPGREFTAGVLGRGSGSFCLGVVETHARDHLSGFAEKLATGAESPTRRFAPVDDGDLQAQLSGLAVDAYRALGCRDVARVDIRLDASGAPQLLEINALPGLAPGRSALPILASFAGIEHGRLITLILHQALERLALERRRPGPVRPTGSEST